MRTLLSIFPLKLENFVHIYFVEFWHLTIQDLSIDVSVKIYRDGKQLNLSQLEKDYQNWISQMHDLYDQEIDCGEDEPVLVIDPLNKKQLGVTSNSKNVKIPLLPKFLLLLLN